MTKPLISFFMILSFFFTGSLFAQEEAPWNFISHKACGVDRFLAEHPTFDGRGVVVFILDNGADVHVPGLLTTSEGKPKFVDAQDFTGEGDVELEKVELLVDGSVKSEDGETLLKGVNTLSLKAKEGDYHLGVLKEDQFQNSEFAGATGTTDVNDNGRSDDEFGILAFPVAGEEHWVVYIDSDGDGDLEGEKPLRNFRDKTDDKFYFHRARPDRQVKPFVLVANVFPGEEKVTFHYASGAHSTHVSGIVAGFRIDGQDGFNGIAPGAQLVSCKIGDCTLAGGATVRESVKKAFEHAKKFHREKKVPVVLNMSYGIGSELEGTTDIDRYVNRLLLENPGMFFCTSAGNEGPGISTVGTPAASHMAYSVGAVMAKDVARNVYNAELPGHRLLHFSSRGGELDKPDFIAPGACLSSVPRWLARSRMWGTSMASPYAAGSVALLLSAAMQEFPGVEVTSHMVRRALENSARSLDLCGPLDEGRGMIDLPGAWEMLKEYCERERARPDPVLAYDIETFCPEGAQGKARAAYWRSVYRPGEKEKQTFRIKALFVPDTPAQVIDEFARKFILKSESPLLELIPDSVMLRKDGAAAVTLTYDQELLEEPGPHTARISAYEGEVRPENRAFDLLNTVIVPYTFGPKNDYALHFMNKTVQPLEVHRYYLAVPPGAGSMEIKMTAVNKEFALARMELCDPEGRTQASLRGLDTRRGVLDAGTRVKGGDLVPGVWELLVYGDYTSGAPSRYNVSAAFFGIQVLEAPPMSLDYKPGGAPKGTARIVNRFNKAVWTDAAGEVWGYSRKRKVEMKDKDTWSYTFGLDEGIEKVRFKVAMSPKHYGLFTDFAINIMDGGGEAVVKEGLSYKFTEFEFENPGGGGKYTLEMVAGYTHAKKAPFDFELTEEFVYLDPVPMTLSSDISKRAVILIPDIPVTLKYALESPPPVAPKGFATTGTVTLTEQGTDIEAFEFDVRAK